MKRVRCCATRACAPGSRRSSSPRGPGSPSPSEAEGANPRVATLERLLRAAGARLELAAPEARVPDVDEGQILARLRLSPGERLASFTTSHRNLNDMLHRARRIHAA